MVRGPRLGGGVRAGALPAPGFLAASSPEDAAGLEIQVGACTCLASPDARRLQSAPQPSMTSSSLPGGHQPHLQPHPPNHPVLHPASVRPEAAEGHAAAAAGQGHLQLASQGTQRHQRQEEVPEGAAGAADPGPAPPGQVPRLRPAPCGPPSPGHICRSRTHALPSSTPRTHVTDPPEVSGQCFQSLSVLVPERSGS